MKRKRYTEEKIIAIVKEHEAGGLGTGTVAPLRCRGEHDLPLESQVRRHGGVGCPAAA